MSDKVRLSLLISLVFLPFWSVIIVLSGVPFYRIMKHEPRYSTHDQLSAEIDLILTEILQMLLFLNNLVFFAALVTGR
jgi:hypothetical protein